ncbi:MAG: hypothetical protein OEZ39_17925 [Gammaproteobacteria bacterium]|nr:hypothetical protein [Gammaproteobacteria bacterium]MDH5653745.1 hypothetical protein [Gammaproteobacteria bacterium]
MNRLLLRPVYHLMILLAGFPAFITAAAADEPRYKPFVLAQTVDSTDLKQQIDTVKQKLAANGYQIIGEYTPYIDNHILVITNDRLRKHAARTEFGGYGASQRVAFNKSGNRIQISHTNPVYMAHAYRMQSDLQDVRKQLAGILGYEQDFGARLGLTAKALRKYHYDFLMPYFTDHMNLAEYKTQQAAIDYIEKSLQGKNSTVKKVYRIDIPGKQETVFGVQFKGKDKDDCSSDDYIMSRVDFENFKATAHLPYEILISKGRVFALFAEFRIAISFPDLSMVGRRSFATIICAPSAIENSLIKVTGGTDEEY